LLQGEIPTPSLLVLVLMLWARASSVSATSLLVQKRGESVRRYEPEEEAVSTLNARHARCGERSWGISQTSQIYWLTCAQAHRSWDLLRFPALARSHPGVSDSIIVIASRRSAREL
jgi:hypothetical protein